MASGIGLILVAVIYLVTLSVLVRTAGFRKNKKQSKSILHFRSKAIAFELGLIGLFNLLIGLIWLGLWIFFLFSGWESFQAKFDFLIPHVLLQLAVAFSLMISGIATIVESGKWQLIYILSLILLLISTIVSLVFYGPYGHGEPLTMLFLGIWSFCVAGIMTFGLFVLHRVLVSRIIPRKPAST